MEHKTGHPNTNVPQNKELSLSAERINSSQMYTGPRIQNKSAQKSRRTENEYVPKQPTLPIRQIQKMRENVASGIEMNAKETEFTNDTESPLVILPRTSTKAPKSMAFSELAKKYHDVNKNEAK